MNAISKLLWQEAYLFLHKYSYPVNGRAKAEEYYRLLADANRAITVDGQFRATDGSHARMIVSADERVGAAVTESHIVLLAQWRGLFREPLILRRDDYPAFQFVVKDWASKRDDWPEHLDYGTGSAAGGVHVWCYQAAGPRSELVTRFNTHSKTKHKTGKDETRPLAKRIAIFRGVYITHEVWHVGAELSPPEGVQTGLVYSLKNKLNCTARRLEAAINGFILQAGYEFLIQNLGSMILQDS